MNQDVIDAFSEASSNVFRTMLDLELVIGKPTELPDSGSRGVSGIIGLTGRISGDVIISLDANFAKNVTAKLLGGVTDEVDDVVRDAIGELTNMIVGNAKGRLEAYDLELSLPTVVLGTDYRIGFQRSVSPIQLPFQCDYGPFEINLGLTEVAAASCV